MFSRTTMKAKQRPRPVPEPHALLPLTVFDCLHDRTTLVIGWMVEGKVESAAFEGALTRLTRKWRVLAGRIESVRNKVNINHFHSIPTCRVVSLISFSHFCAYIWSIRGNNGVFGSPSPTSHRLFLPLRSQAPFQVFPWPHTSPTWTKWYDQCRSNSAFPNRRTTTTTYSFTRPRRSGMPLLRAEF